MCWARTILIDYHWDVLWGAIVAVLVFVLAKQEALAQGATAIEAVIAEAIVVLDLAVARADGFLPTPESVHQLVVRPTAFIVFTNLIYL
jgi:hypothetical protein